MHKKFSILPHKNKDLWGNASGLIASELKFRFIGNKYSGLT